ncbi:hypothetical protein GA0061099_1001230 [Bradyrhizobium yuanmingense]|uniref:Uncharacterized protein n=1 Tax=Bradyrhizobium yuanmingense TaxID=108015 RepID=A0A1C3TYT2_9BRAD|nr:hypothetical protein [Bradyrhizobium yuanmingense]TWI30635.1 hypothetical protein IQ15_01530 [Bradyrhizobium yuanmingense]SCB08302.1 hypothetical protein GA0061099_1001230 [Bradyrhizobium yuanmingense]
MSDENPCATHQDALLARATDLSKNLKDRIKSITGKYEQEFERLREEGPDPDNPIEGWIGIDIDVSWEVVTIKLDLPEVTMKLQDWSFDIPQTELVQREIIFHTPSVRMETRKVGQYPEFHGFTVRWKDILIDVPVPFMQEQKIIMGVPEFRMGRVGVKLHIPEFAMRTQEIKLNLPQFTVKNIRAEVRTVEERSQQLQAAMKAEVAAGRKEVANSAGTDISKAANTLFTCLRTNIQVKKDQTLAVLEPSIVMFRDTASKLRSINSTETSARAAEMEGQLSALLERKAQIAKDFEKQIDDLIEQEKKTVEAILGGLRAA